MGGGDGDQAKDKIENPEKRTMGRAQVPEIQMPTWHYSFAPVVPAKWRDHSSFCVQGWIINPGDSPQDYIVTRCCSFREPSKPWPRSRRHYSRDMRGRGRGSVRLQGMDESRHDVGAFPDISGLQTAFRTDYMPCSLAPFCLHTAFGLAYVPRKKEKITPRTVRPPARPLRHGTCVASQIRGRPFHEFRALMPEDINLFHAPSTRPGRIPMRTDQPACSASPCNLPRSRLPCIIRPIKLRGANRQFQAFAVLFFFQPRVWCFPSSYQ